MQRIAHWRWGMVWGHSMRPPHSTVETRSPCLGLPGSCQVPVPPVLGAVHTGLDAVRRGWVGQHSVLWAEQQWGEQSAGTCLWTMRRGPVAWPFFMHLISWCQFWANIPVGFGCQPNCKPLHVKEYFYMLCERFLITEMAAASKTFRSSYQRCSFLDEYMEICKWLTAELYLNSKLTGSNFMQSKDRLLFSATLSTDLCLAGSCQPLPVLLLALKSSLVSSSACFWT